MSMFKFEYQRRRRMDCGRIKSAWLAYRWVTTPAPF